MQNSLKFKPLDRFNVIYRFSQVAEGQTSCDPDESCPGNDGRQHSNSSDDESPRGLPDDASLPDSPEDCRCEFSTYNLDALVGDTGCASGDTATETKIEIDN